ncbi:MaoC/PaaZ C-terminal domain-containing protein [Variovorax sp. dw_308]|uniref:MaoC/PaaZ C-terminal domain-containing protein n=1 Tax=Variovorax sp. dw_308 TaxID=2721546 RepID=UPI001C45D9C2|nr:MaoC/PaaZ C-terminal domain-containing protein [Variovorax sp. dw_308]
MIDYPKLRNWAFPDVEHRYTCDDTIRYALALGVGSNPTDEGQLKFVNDVVEGTPFAMPTMAVILGFPGSWMQAPETGIDFSKIVHGEELLVIHHPLPASATIVARHRIVRIVDKGPTRGATVTYDKDVIDQQTGLLYATVTHTTFARGDGGFSAASGLTDEATAAPQRTPDGEPHAAIELATLPQQALMYRMSADRNPLHSTPEVAHAAGFERPILHGLCTYGIASRALLETYCGSDPRRLKRLFARFTAPVYPGETIRVEMYREGSTVLFRARVKERDRVVLDFGAAELSE